VQQKEADSEPCRVRESRPAAAFTFSCISLAKRRRVLWFRRSSENSLAVVETRPYMHNIEHLRCIDQSCFIPNETAALRGSPAKNLPCNLSTIQLLEGSRNPRAFPGDSCGKSLDLPRIDLNCTCEDGDLSWCLASVCLQSEKHRLLVEVRPRPAANGRFQGNCPPSIPFLSPSANGLAQLKHPSLGFQGAAGSRISELSFENPVPSARWRSFSQPGPPRSSVCRFSIGPIGLDPNRS
jgi:hypothetical protein